MDPARREQLVAVAHAHAAAEGAGDLDATLGTLEDEPFYELHPMRRIIRGKDAARRIYEHFFEHYLSLGDGYELKAEWVTDEGVGQEYVIRLRHPDGTTEVENVVGILLFGNERLAGERVYASERMFRLMYGPTVDEAEPLG